MEICPNTLISICFLLKGLIINIKHESPQKDSIVGRIFVIAGVKYSQILIGNLSMFLGSMLPQYMALCVSVSVCLLTVLTNIRSTTV